MGGQGRVWILGVWDNGKKNMKLDQPGFIEVAPLSRYFRFNVELCSI